MTTLDFLVGSRPALTTSRRRRRSSKARIEGGQMRQTIPRGAEADVEEEETITIPREDEDETIIINTEDGTAQVVAQVVAVDSSSTNKIGSPWPNQRVNTRKVSERV
jgi:hypothetical protein